MRIVLAYRTLVRLGGSETYLLTVAEQLERLGHEVTIYTETAGETADMFEAGGGRLARALEELPEACDAVLAQDPLTAYALAERYPNSARVFVVHSIDSAKHLPPQAAGVSHAVVALNERVAQRIQALAVAPELVRLHQPIDLERFGPLAIRRPRPRRVIAFGNSFYPSTVAMIERCCTQLGLQLEHVGRRGSPTAAPEHEIAEADIVIGAGRCLLEAMASARAAYVLGPAGSDGWVTPAAYPRLEADGFAGLATERVIDEPGLLEDLRGWSRKMGEQNRELAVRNHDAVAHAASLVALWRRLGGQPSPSSELGEMARLVRLEMRTQGRLNSLAERNLKLQFQLERLEAGRGEPGADGNRADRPLRRRLAGRAAGPLRALRSLARRRVSRGEEARPGD